MVFMLLVDILIVVMACLCAYFWFEARKENKYLRSHVAGIMHYLSSHHKTFFIKEINIGDLEKCPPFMGMYYEIGEHLANKKVTPLLRSVSAFGTTPRNANPLLHWIAQLQESGVSWSLFVLMYASMLETYTVVKVLMCIVWFAALFFSVCEYYLFTAVCTRMEEYAARQYAKEKGP